MRRARLGGAAGWVVVATTALAGASPAFGRRGGRVAVMGQALVPWTALPTVPVAIGALRHGRRGLLAGAVAVLAVGAALARRMAGPPAHGAPPSSGGGTIGRRHRPLTIAHANLLFVNTRMERVAARLGALDADVLTFSEYTPDHARVLHADGLVTRYPHRLERAAPRASGTALWSRWPITPRPGPPLRHETVVADVHGPGEVTVHVVHTSSPIRHFAAWRDELAMLPSPPAANGTARPAVLIGDLNASWGHPALRRLLAAGWRSAHQLTGRGLSPSWPITRLLPPFVRLDHALVSAGLAVTDVVDAAVPGSDHRALMVSVVAAP